VEAESEMEAIEIAKKATMRKYPDGQIKLVEVLKSD